MKPFKNIIVGIDLAAKPSNPTGWALLEGLSLSATSFYQRKNSLGNHPVHFGTNGYRCL